MPDQENSLPEVPAPVPAQATPAVVAEHTAAPAIPAPTEVVEATTAPQTPVATEDDIPEEAREALQKYVTIKMVVEKTGMNPNSISTACRKGQLPNAKKVRASQYGNKPMWLIPLNDAKEYIRNYKNGGISSEYEIVDIDDLD